MAAELRVAVIGVGHLGRYHAQKYAALDGVELVAVADRDPGRAAAVAAECATTACDDYRRLIGRVDAVSIAVPAREHYPIARDLLDAGVHVLVEKPITAVVAEARELVGLAERRGLCLQVGHLERFNPAVLALSEQLHEPLFVECYRIAPFQPRGTDVSVVLDLMIHDIDLLLALVDTPLVGIDASGTAVLTEQLDIVNARLKFQGGCVANLTASRVSAKSEAKLRLFQRDSYFSLDLREKRLTVRRKSGDRGPVPEITVEQQAFAEHDALYLEVRAFVDSIRDGTPPVVSGEVGLRALQAAEQIGRGLLGAEAN